MRHLLLVCPMLLLTACAGSREPSLNQRPTLAVADAAMEGGQPQIALNVARGILARDAYNFPAWLMLGNSLYSLKLYPEAESAFNVVLKVRASDPEANLGLGRVKLAEQDPRAAEQHFRRSAEQQPRPETFSNLGVALDLQHRPLEAQAEYRRALQLDPDSAATQANLALSLRGSGDVVAPMGPGDDSQRSIQSQPLGLPTKLSKPGASYAPE